MVLGVGPRCGDDRGARPAGRHLHGPGLQMIETGTARQFGAVPLPVYPCRDSNAGDRLRRPMLYPTELQGDAVVTRVILPQTDWCTSHQGAFRMGADTLLPQPLTHDHGLCAASPSGKCRGLRKVLGTDSVPGTWTGAPYRIGKTAVLIFAPRWNIPTITNGSRRAVAFGGQHDRCGRQVEPPARVSSARLH